MATPTIKTKITLDGEKEYKKQLSEINAGLKVLRSEMDLTSTEFADQAGSVEALTASGDVLERQILAQKEKIEALEGALQNAAESYGEADKKTSDWKTSLNKAKADLIKLERAQEENAEALREATEATEQSEEAYKDMADAMGETEDGTKSMGDMVEELAGKLGVQLPKGAKEAIDSIMKFDGKVALMAGTVATALTAVIKLEKAMINLTRERAGIAAGILNLSQTIGFSVEATQEWDYVLKTLGGSIQEAQGDLSAFQEKMLEAMTGEGEAAEMFAQLGVNVKDLGTGALRPAEAVLLDVVHALQLMDDQTKRNAISSTLLGGTGEKLIPIYNGTAEELDALLQKKREMGVLSEAELETMGRVNTAMIDYEERVNAARDALAVKFAPALEAFYDDAGKGIQDLAGTFADSGIIEMAGALLELLGATIPILDALSPILGTTAYAFEGMANAIGLISDAIDTVTEKLGVFADVAKRIFSQNLLGSVSQSFFGNPFSQLGKISKAIGLLTGTGEKLTTYQEAKEAGYQSPGLSYDGRSRGGDTYNFNINTDNLDSVNKLVKDAQNQKRKRRMETGGE